MDACQDWPSQLGPHPGSSPGSYKQDGPAPRTDVRVYSASGSPL